MVDHNGKRAALAAGYSKKSAEVMAAKLLQLPHIRAFLDKCMEETRKKFEVDADTILRHMVACATRDGKDFVDDSGVLLLVSGNIRDLPSEITLAIDGIKQRIKKTYNEDGDVEYEILEVELKLVSKASAIEMCAKHKGLFAPEKHEHEHRVQFDFASLSNPPAYTPAQEIEDKIIEVKALPPPATK